jgi:hypothetical protein
MLPSECILTQYGKKKPRTLSTREIAHDLGVVCELKPIGRDDTPDSFARVGETMEDEVVIDTYTRIERLMEL